MEGQSHNLKMLTRTADPNSVQSVTVMSSEIQVLLTTKLNAPIYLVKYRFAGYAWRLREKNLLIISTN